MLAALSKQSCSTGACHGSPTGKGGFRLSLRGFDPAFDQLTLIREDLGRRSNVPDPAASLLLLKPLMKLPHGGGQRLKTSDLAYTILRDWIAQGCRPDEASAPQCVSIEVSPRAGEVVLELVGNGLRAIPERHGVRSLQVQARFSDGTTRDVTPLTVFSSSDEEVATVDSAGLVSGKERGQAAILCRYLDHIDTAAFTFLRDVPGFVWPNPPESNYIDAHVFHQLKRLQIPPSELTGDYEFIRRVYLDVLGILPTRAEVEAFAADSAPDKRARLSDALVERPEYAEFWAAKWGDLLRLKSGKIGGPAVHKLHRWLVQQVRENRPYNQIARELLTASGSTLINPPANFYRTAADVNDCAETTAQLFLGIRMQCAKCHNHPFDRWSQDSYYQLGAFFSRVGRQAAADPDEMVIFTLTRGEVTQPRTGRQVVPALPLVAMTAIKPAEDRRLALASQLTAVENRQFAEVAANRIWGQLLGRCIVEPVDDFRPSNPPSNAPLLAAITDAFIQSGFDQKQLIRAILRSRTYQLMSSSTELNARDEKCFSHARARLLPAESLLDAICQATGVPETFATLPAGTRAGQLPSPDFGNHFLKIFGQPGRESPCACERTSDPKLTQALQLINGPLLTSKLRDPAGRLARAPTDERAALSDFYYAALCRPPQEEEIATALAYLAQHNDRRQGFEDVCWAVLNSKEFLFQH